MRFRNSLAGVVIDRFGRDSMLIPDGAEHFTFTAQVTISPAFLGWLSQFGSKASVVYPPSVAQQHRDLLRDALTQSG